MPDQEDSVAPLPWESLSPQEQAVLHNMWHQDIFRQMSEFAAQMGTFGKRLDENTAATERIERNTASLLEVVTAGRKVGAFGRWVGRVAAAFYRFFLKYILPTAVGLATIWLALKDSHVTTLKEFVKGLKP